MRKTFEATALLLATLASLSTAEELTENLLKADALEDNEIFLLQKAATAVIDSLSAKELIEGSQAAMRRPPRESLVSSLVEATPTHPPAKAPKDSYWLCLLVILWGAVIGLVVLTNLPKAPPSSASVEDQPVLTNKQKKLCASGFGFIVGYTDLVCLFRYHAFGTMMTGNLLMIANSIVKGGPPRSGMPQPSYYLLLIVFRCFGLGLYKLAAKTRLGAATVLAPMLLAAMLTVEAMDFSGALPDAGLNVMIVSMMFGVQSSVTHPTIREPTILATGHMTNMFVTFVESLTEGKSLESIILPSWIVFGMVAGAFSGAGVDKALHDSKLASFALAPAAAFQMFLMLYIEWSLRAQETVKQQDPEPSKPSLQDDAAAKPQTA